MTEKLVFSSKNKVLSLFIFVLVFCVIVVSARIINSKNQIINLHQPQLFTIDRGESFYTVCKSLMGQQLINDCFGHKFEAKFMSRDISVKSGTYQIVQGLSLEQLVLKFTKGQEIQFSFTILEGENLYQVIDKMKKTPHVVDDVSSLKWDTLAQKVGLDEAYPEGYFYPDTYFYTDNTAASAILSRSVNKQRKVLTQLWAERSPDTLLKTPYEALTLASIIEKESSMKSERDVIASVFYNRLRKRMRLQTDPTVIYGVWSEYDGDITRQHLRQKTPYNTYRINGLPPTPIANPSASAIEAALHPADTDFFYFVAAGDGSHVFSKTLKEHNLAVKRYLEKTRS